jgi:hypothetical protein
MCRILCILDDEDSNVWFVILYSEDLRSALRLGELLLKCQNGELF